MVSSTGSLSGGPDANTERVGRPGERRGSVEETQTTAILDDIVYSDEPEEVEILQVLPATGWAAEFEDGRREPLAVWVVEDSGEMYGVVVEDDAGRIDLSNNAGEQPGFRRYVNNDKED